MKMEEGPYISHYFGEQVQTRYLSRTGWLTCGVHHSIPWPEKDVLVHYDGKDYFLRGLKEQEDKLGSACITVPLEGKSDLMRTLSEIYKFTSILGWFKRGYVDVIGYISSSNPVVYGGRNQPFMPFLASGPFGFNCNFMPVIRDEKTRMALAFWREGLSLEHIHAGYSFLSFYKVVESQFGVGSAKGHWIDAAIPSLSGRAGKRIAVLRTHALNCDIGKHIYRSGRCAVAHASFGKELVDPDIPEDKVRIERDLDVIRALARKYIREELGVPDELDVYENRDALRPIYDYIGPSQVSVLQAGGSIPNKELGLNNVLVSINHWPFDAPVSLSNLKLSVLSAHNGVIDVRADNDPHTLSLIFSLSFTKKKAFTNLDASGFMSVERGGAPDDEIAFLSYQKAVIGNGTIEIQFPNGEKVVCEIVIPVNIDIGRTFESIDRRIEVVRKHMGAQQGDNC